MIWKKMRSDSLKTLIVYATTYGYTVDCVQSLCEQIKGEKSAINISKNNNISIDGFDTIVIGGSIYMGQIQKQVKNFCNENLEVLKQKNIALFLCCGFVHNFELNLKNSYPSELLNIAFSKECFGGELRLERMKFAHKMITNLMKKATQDDGNTNAVSLPENITLLAHKINQMEMK